MRWELPSSTNVSLTPRGTSLILLLQFNVRILWKHHNYVVKWAVKGTIKLLCTCLRLHISNRAPYMEQVSEVHMHVFCFTNEIYIHVLCIRSFWLVGTHRCFSWAWAYVRSHSVYLYLSAAHVMFVFVALNNLLDVGIAALLWRNILSPTSAMWQYLCITRQHWLQLCLT